ncbi:AAA family ATPase [Brevibacterium casei]|uniref:AAA family ATPase n=1 Tax=Brevibacterium casei TaxID=33889 RepID=UPI001919B620|nr:AAA family ATPase [Brevibacterium casei]QQT70710.1 AAA family ATPase [Brevibacterium casei]
MSYLLKTATGTKPVEVLDWIEERRNATPEIRDQMDLDAESGELLTADGQALSPEVERQARRRLLDRFGILEPKGEHHFAPLFGQYARETEPSEWLIPGLWPSDTIPMLAGNHKAGKTTLVTDLVASLVTPERPFLGRFGPVESANRDVYLINAETPSASMRDALIEAGVREDAYLTVDDIEQLGGPHLFDLTIPELYDQWAERLSYCTTCDHDDPEAGVPGVVIVDGLTAILGGETDRYAKWYAAFRRLMFEIGVRNALITGHSTMDGKHSMGGVEMLGGPDGLWTYWTSDPDNPTSRRFFKVQPRLGGAVVPKTEVRLEEGRLTASESTEDNPSKPEEADPRTVVVERLRQAQPEGLLTTELTGKGRFGTERRAALKRLSAEGVVTSRPEGRSTRWFLSEPSD